MDRQTDRQTARRTDGQTSRTTTIGIFFREKKNTKNKDILVLLQAMPLTLMELLKTLNLLLLLDQLCSF